MKTIFDSECTLFPSMYATRKPTYLSIGETLDRIQDGTYKTIIGQARKKLSAGDKEAYSQIKNNLPAIVFQGKFPHRAIGGIEAPSQFLSFDIDHVKNAEEVKEHLSHDEYVSAAFVSPSNEGVKGLVRIPETTDNEAVHYIFGQMAAHIKSNHGYEIDRACKDISRVCFMSHDPNLFRNQDSLELPIDWEAYKNAQVQKLVEAEKKHADQKVRAAALKKELSQNTGSAKTIEDLCQKKLEYHLQWMVDKLSGASPSDPLGGRHQAYVACGILAKSMLDGYASHLTSIDDLAAHVASIRGDFRPVDDSTFRQLAEHSNKAETITAADIWGEFQEWKEKHPVKPTHQEAPHPADVGGCQPIPEKIEPEDIKTKDVIRWPVDEKKLLESVSFNDVNALLNEPLKRGKKHFVGNCSCDDGNMKLVWNVTSQEYMCKACGDSGRLTKLFAKLTGQPQEQANVQLVSTLAPDLMPKEKLSYPERISQFLLLKHKFLFNDLEEAIYIDSKPFTRELESSLHVECVRHGLKGKTLIIDVAISESVKRRVHPIKKYFEGLHFDGGNHIEKLATYINDSESIFEILFKKWVVQAVAKVYTGSQNQVLTLVGGQNMGKSFFARWLCPSTIKEYYVECGQIDPYNKDHQIMHATNFIGEVGELGSTTKQKETRAVKDFFTKETLTFRPPYGKQAIKKKACMSFIATENEDGTGFLKDTTGNRRFLVADIQGINWKYAKECNIDQIWAQAYHMYVNGEIPTLNDIDKEKINKIISSHEQTTIELEYLLMLFDVTHNGADVISAMELQEYMKENGYSEKQSVANYRISKELKRLGVGKVHSRDGTKYVGIKTKDEGEDVF